MIEARTLWELVERRAAESPDGVMIVDESGTQLTFGDYRQRAETAAAGLARLGIGEGTVVSWQLPNWIETVVLVAALSRLGAVQNPIAPLYRTKEVSFIVGQLQADVLILPTTWRDFDYGAMAESIRSERPELQVLLVDRDLPQGDPAELPAPPTDTLSLDGGPLVRWVLYTSGTTSDPKGARHTDQGFIVTAQNVSRCMHMVEGDRNALVFPFAHIGGIIYVFADLQFGATSIMLERFGPHSIPILAREGVTIAGAGVPFFHEYLKAQLRSPDPIFPKLKAFVGGGSTRPPELGDELRDAFGVGVLAGYGLTEAGSFTMSDLDDAHELQDLTEGRPYPGAEIRIRTADGTIVGPGVEGEVTLRGPQLMVGYVDADLDVAFDEDGFFSTGDLGLVDEGGYLRITGRIKDIIIRKGENISAREVEDLLFLHPAIDEAVVIPLSDPETGERACAVLTLHDPDVPVDLDELRRFLVGKGLAVQKVPEQLEIVDELPKNVGGKVRKPALRARFEKEGSHGSSR